MVNKRNKHRLRALGKILTNTLNKAATLNGNILGELLSCGTRGIEPQLSVEGDLAITSDIYDCSFVFENAAS